jgi:hypothetical protein
MGRVLSRGIFFLSVCRLYGVSDLGFTGAAAAVLAVRDEAESAVEGTVAAIIRMSADAFGDASEDSGEAAVGLVAGVAEGPQCGFRSMDVLARLVGAGGFRSEVGGFHAGEGGVRSQGGPAGEEIPGAVEDVVVAELLHDACKRIAAGLQERSVLAALRRDKFGFLNGRGGGSRDAG